MNVDLSNNDRLIISYCLIEKIKNEDKLIDECFGNAFEMYCDRVSDDLKVLRKVGTKEAFRKWFKNK